MRHVIQFIIGLLASSNLLFKTVQCEASYGPRPFVYALCPPACSCGYSIELPGITIDCVDKNSTRMPFPLSTKAVAINLDTNDIVHAVGINKCKKLKVLRLSNNQVTHISHETFKGMASLLYLLMDANPLKELTAGVFDDLVNLHHLDLRYTNLKTLPIGLLHKLRSLHEMRFDGSPIATLDPQTFAGLDKLTMATFRHTRIKTIPDLAGLLPSLLFVDMIFSPINCDCKSALLAENDNAGLVSALCETPVKFKDKYWYDVTGKDLNCPVNGKPRAGDMLMSEEEEYEEIEVPPGTLEDQMEDLMDYSTHDEF